ncbi:MAG: BON domain-containing protein [Pseudomonadota bacterium]|nr:BON domain-containing protein [Pseudomonadota bacterium]
MTKNSHTRPAAIALAVLMAAALGACSKSEQEQAERKVDQAANQAAEAGRELKADAQEAGREIKAEAQEAGREAAAAGRELKEDAAQAGRELKADAAEATAAARAEVAKAGEAIKEGARDAAGLASDVAITTSVNAKLAADPELSALRINVDTKDGAVTLNGPAPTQAAKDRASTLAREVEGVKSVTNNLSIS